VQITEVRIHLNAGGDERLLAFCSITFEAAFVVRDIKIIRGLDGPFVAMPSRKLMARCPACGMKNVVRAGYCNACGRSLPVEADVAHRRLHADIAHPINSASREALERAILHEYEAERARASQPGYVVRQDDWGDDLTDIDPVPPTDPAASPDPMGRREPSQHGPPPPRRLDRPASDPQGASNPDESSS